MKSRTWIAGCYVKGGTTVLSGPTMLFNDECVVREVISEEVTILREEYDAMINEIAALKKLSQEEKCQK